MTSNTEAAAEEGVILSQGSFSTGINQMKHFGTELVDVHPNLAIWSRHTHAYIHTHTHTYSAVNTYLEQLAL